jgi:hypothetical protein
VALFGTTRLFGVALIGTIGVRVSLAKYLELDGRSESRSWTGATHYSTSVAAKGFSSRMPAFCNMLS